MYIRLSCPGWRESLDRSWSTKANICSDSVTPDSGRQTCSSQRRDVCQFDSNCSISRLTRDCQWLWSWPSLSCLLTIVSSQGLRRNPHGHSNVSLEWLCCCRSIFEDVLLCNCFTVGGKTMLTQSLSVIIIEAEVVSRYPLCLSCLVFCARFTDTAHNYCKKIRHFPVRRTSVLRLLSLDQLWEQLSSSKNQIYFVILQSLAWLACSPYHEIVSPSF